MAVGEAGADPGGADASRRAPWSAEDAHHRLLFDHHPDAVFALDREGRLLESNAACQRLLGYGDDELRGRAYASTVHPDDLAAIDAEFRRALHGEVRAYEARGVARDGRELRLQVTNIPVVVGDEVVRVYGIARDVSVPAEDVTEARLAEERLRRSDALRRLAGQVALVGGWSIEGGTQQVYWSEEIFRILEAPAGEEPTVEECLALYPPGPRERLGAALEACLGQGEPFDLELEIDTFAGRRISIRAIGEAERDAEGRILRAMGAFQDITVERRVRLDLEERGAALRRQAALLEEAQDAIIVRDLDDRVTFWNRSAERLYGWSREEALGRDLRTLVKPDRTTVDAIEAVLHDTGAWVGEIHHRTRGGASLVVAARWTLVHDEEGRPEAVFEINTDVTEQKRVEQQLFRAQRTESLGTLAGGVAHDLNNVLAPIMLAADLLETGASEPEQQRRLVKMIGSSARRGADLVSQVLSFARGVEGQRDPLDVGALLDDIAGIVRDTFPKDIALTLQVPDGLGTTIGDSTQIQQVLLNLAVNARDAMPEGGALAISASNIHLGQRHAAAGPAAPPGPYLLIEVEDDGVGMPPEVRDRVFEPFFTTKAHGAGTGLGLSTAAAIIRSHGGFLNVYSEPGGGSRFHLYLPIDDVELDDGAPPEPADLPWGAGETVLVADDEPAVRAVTRQILEAYGYRVMEAGDGQEAVTAFAAEPSRVDVVLTDMMMPVMDGPAAVEALRELDPTVRIVAASGLHVSDKVASVTAAGVRHVLPKPFTTHALLSVIAEVLDERR